MVEFSRALPSRKHIGDWVMPTKCALEVRFHEHHIPEPNSGCWLWIGATIRSRKGALYGVIKKDREVILQEGGSNELAHRVSYQLHKGKITALQIDHLCRNTLCVNPDHLEPVNQPENVRRGYLARHGNACKRGHEFTVENTYIDATGGRHCRRCHADREAQKRAQSKQ